MKEITDLTEYTGLPAVVDDGSPTTGGESYFLVAKNGFFKVLDNEEIRAVVRLDKLPGGLPEAKESLHWKGPRLPLVDFDFIVSTMRRFYMKSKCEVDFHIHYSKDTGFWYRVPRQEVSGGRTEWDIDGGSVWLKNGMVFDAPPENDTDLHRIGNMHSHHRMAPEWSDLDNQSMHDVEYGIQIVVGWFETGFGSKSRIALHGRYADVPLTAVVDFGDSWAVDLPDWLFKPQEPPTDEKKPQPRRVNGEKRKTGTNCPTVPDADSSERRPSNAWKP